MRRISKIGRRTILNFKRELLFQGILEDLTYSPDFQSIFIVFNFIAAPTCGGRLYGNFGNLESPKFSRLYPFPITCTWVLEVGPFSTIDFQLLSASFYNENCESSLVIRDGISYDSKQIGMYCKNVSSSTFKSQRHIVYIEQTIEQNTESSFELNWLERTQNSFQGMSSSYSTRAIRRILIGLG